MVECITTNIEVAVTFQIPGSILEKCFPATSQKLLYCSGSLSVKSSGLFSVESEQIMA
jgi:hypothetical protein